MSYPFEKVDDVDLFLKPISRLLKHSLFSIQSAAATEPVAKNGKATVEFLPSPGRLRLVKILEVFLGTLILYADASPRIHRGLRSAVKMLDEEVLKVVELHSDKEHL